jgi:cytochrome P450
MGRVNDTFAAFEAQVLALVDQRREEEHEGVERHDLFSRLISASDSQSPRDQLTTQQLIANVHIFMTAGFMTTGHAVAVALMFLAMHPREQDAVAEEARSVLGTEGVVPAYDKFSQLVSWINQMIR